MDEEVRRAWAHRHGEPATKRRRLNILGLTGSEFSLEVDPSGTVQEIYQLFAEKVDIRPGCMPVLLCGLNVLDEARLVLEQLDGHAITYVVRQVGAGLAAVSFMRALAPEARICLLHPAEAHALNAVSCLVFGRVFNNCLEGVTPPSSLQTLTFGENFNQSLQGVTLPSSLQTLTFGENFNQSLQGVTLPSILQTLTFGERFNRSFYFYERSTS